MSDDMKQKNVIGMSLGYRYPIIAQKFRALSDAREPLATGVPVYDSGMAFSGGIFWRPAYELFGVFQPRFEGQLAYFRSSGDLLSEQRVSVVDGPSINPEEGQLKTSNDSVSIDALNVSLLVGLDHTFRETPIGFGVHGGLDYYQAHPQLQGLLPGGLETSTDVAHWGGRVGLFVYLEPTALIRLGAVVEQRFYGPIEEGRGEYGEIIQVDPPSGTFVGVRAELTPFRF